MFNWQMLRKLRPWNDELGNTIVLMRYNKWHENHEKGCDCYITVIIR